MVEAGFSSYCRVDVLQELFANSPDLAFGRVNKSASGFVLKVVFVVFECYKGLSFSHNIDNDNDNNKEDIETDFVFDK